MPWKRCGLIYSPDGAAKTRMGPPAMPNVRRPTASRIRRCGSILERETPTTARGPTFVEVDADRPEHVEYVHDRPVLELGELGCFDDAGVMPFCIVNVDGAKFLYYAGCNTSTTVPYRMSIGLAVSEDGGRSFRRLHPGADSRPDTRRAPFLLDAVCHSQRPRVENVVFVVPRLAADRRPARTAIPREGGPFRRRTSLAARRFDCHRAKTHRRSDRAPLGPSCRKSLADVVLPSQSRRLPNR